MAVVTFWKFMGRSRSGWFKRAFLWILSFLILFSGTRSWFFGLLNLQLSGLPLISWIVALILGLMGWDALFTK